MPNDVKNSVAVTPGCPRCDSNLTELVSTSPVAGAWVVYNCPVCFYSWRSSEPLYATDAAHYNPHFKINPDTIDNFAQVPTIPELRSSGK